jgi:hypothetical protein
METMTMLDNISTAIERVVKDLQGGAAPARKRMRLGEFVDFTMEQLQKAADDEPEAAARRLGTLKRTVDEVLTQVAKLNPEDTDSETVEVEVLTAWAPSKAEGDKPMEDVTTASDQSATETSPLAIKPALGNTSFATNLGDVAKALEKMKEELEAKPGKKEKGPCAAKKADAQGWPLDLNSEGFRKGVQKADTAPTWGYDPEDVATPKE